MIAGGVDIIAGTGGIIHQNIDATIKRELHDHSPELGQTLVDLVVEKTPIRTGALQSSIWAETGGGPGGYGMADDLVYIFAQDLPQLMQWKRVYVQYQEGDPLGLPTYTNAPREMFWLTATTDGLDMVKVWALYYASVALGLCALGVGVPI